MVEILRNKWCEDLDDILQCPVCFICPDSNVLVYQCVEGHTICERCKVKLPLCPTCSQNWSPLRNRLAEELCSKLLDIKLSLIDPEADINKLLLADTYCAATQTDPQSNHEEIDIALNGTAANGTAVKDTADVVQPKIGCVGRVGSGQYPCCIGSCQANLGYNLLTDHILSTHLMHFVELPLNEAEIFFQHTWSVEFTQQLQYDRAFRIPKVGTFFMKLSSNVFDDFMGFISMINSAAEAKQYSYQLKIACCSEHKTPTYTGDVNSCRTPFRDMGKKLLEIKQADMKPMLHVSMLKCTVVLTRKLDADMHHAQPKKKNRSKIRTNAARAVKAL